MGNYTVVTLQEYAGQKVSSVASFNLQLKYTAPINYAPFILNMPQDITIQQCEKQRFQSLWQYQIPAPSVPDGDSVKISVLGISPTLEYSDDLRTLTLVAFQSQERNQTLRITVTDNKGGFSNYFLKLRFHCDTTAETPAKFTPGDPPTALISKITQDGYVFITFNSTMKVPFKPEQLENTTVSIDYKDYPALDVRIIPGVLSLSENLKMFNWTFVNFTATELLLQLHLKTPEWVSINEFKEVLKVTIYANYFFADIHGAFVRQGHEMEKQMPAQIFPINKERVDDVANNVSAVVSGAVVFSLIGYFLLGSGLQKLKGSIDVLQIITFMMTINVATPANCKIFFALMMASVPNRPIDTDDFLTQFLKLEKTTPLSDNWRDLKYKSLHSIQNFGFSIFAFVVWPILIVLVAYLLKVIKVKSMQHMKVRNKMKNFFMFNGPVQWLYFNYIQISACCCLGVFHFKWEPTVVEPARFLQSISANFTGNSTSETSTQVYSYGNILNSLFTIFCAFICVAFPIFVGVHYSKQSRLKPIDQGQFNARWGTLTEPLKTNAKNLHSLQRQTSLLLQQLYLFVSESQEGKEVERELLKQRIQTLKVTIMQGNQIWVCGVEALWYPVCSLLRKLILILTCVFLQNNPTISIFSVNFQIILMAIFIGMGEPFTLKSDWAQALINEFFCLLANYHLLTFTDWVFDGSAREIMGYSLITVTLLTVLFNFLWTSINSATGIGRVAKLNWKRCQVLRKNQSIKKRAYTDRQQVLEKQCAIDVENQLDRPHLIQAKVKSFRLNQKSVVSDSSSRIDVRLEALEKPQLNKNISRNFENHSQQQNHNVPDMSERQFLELQIRMLKRKIPVDLVNLRQLQRKLAALDGHSFNNQLQLEDAILDEKRNQRLNEQLAAKEREEYLYLQRREEDRILAEVNSPKMDINTKLNPLDVHVHSWNIIDIEQRQKQLAQHRPYYPPHPDPRQIQNPYALSSTRDAALSFRAPQIVADQKRNGFPQGKFSKLSLEDAVRYKKHSQSLSANQESSNSFQNDPEFQQPGENYQQWDQRMQKEERALQIRDNQRRLILRDQLNQAQREEWGKPVTTEQAIAKLKKMGQIDW